MPDTATEILVRQLLGGVLSPCPPPCWEILLCQLLGSAGWLPGGARSYLAAKPGAPTTVPFPETH